MSTPVGLDGQTLKVAGTEEFRTVGANDVVYNNEIIGTDPDENVRLQLLKNGGQGFAGGGGDASGS